MTFQLHNQLAADTTVLGEFPLCMVLLHKDKAVPWIILVPKHENLREFHHLSMADQQQFLTESQVISELLETHYQPDKINLGALGNLVPQLHYHHIARFKTDAAWPGPIWGQTSGEFRTEDDQKTMANELQQRLNLCPFFTASFQ